jgi:hypothetical protein
MLLSSRMIASSGVDGHVYPAAAAAAAVVVWWLDQQQSSPQVQR